MSFEHFYCGLLTTLGLKTLAEIESAPPTGELEPITQWEIYVQVHPSRKHFRIYKSLIACFERALKSWCMKGDIILWLIINFGLHVLCIFRTKINQGAEFVHLSHQPCKLLWQTDKSDMGMTCKELSMCGWFQKIKICGPVSMFEVFKYDPLISVDLCVWSIGDTSVD